MGSSKETAKKNIEMRGPHRIIVPLGMSVTLGTAGNYEVSYKIAWTIKAIVPFLDFK